MLSPLTFVDWPDGDMIAAAIGRKHDWQQELPQEITCECRDVADYRCGPPLRYAAVVGRGLREYEVSMRLVNVSWNKNVATLIYEVEGLPI